MKPNRPSYLHRISRLAETALRVCAGLATFTLISGLPAPPAMAQAATPPPAQQPAGSQPAPIKIGVLSVRGAIISTAEGKQAQATLQSQFAARQNDLENMRKQLEDIQNRLNQRTISDEERARLERQGAALQRTYQRRGEDLREDLQAAENDVVEAIGTKMMDVLDRYSRENGFAVVLDISTQATPVIYAATAINITTDIVRLYDQAHPLTAAPAAPATRPPAQPGQQRPPPAAQRPPQ